MPRRVILRFEIEIEANSDEEVKQQHESLIKYILAYTAIVVSLTSDVLADADNGMG